MHLVLAAARPTTAVLALLFHLRAHLGDPVESNGIQWNPMEPNGTQWQQLEPTDPSPPPLEIEISYLNQSLSRLRKVKMDQRKLMDNANTITDMAKVKTLESQLALGVRHFIMNNDEVFLCYQLYI